MMADNEVLTEEQIAAVLSGWFWKWTPKLGEFVRCKVPKDFIPTYQAIQNRTEDENLAIILRATCEVMQVTQSEIRSQSRMPNLVAARRVYLWIASMRTKVPPSVIARTIGRDHSMASKREQNKFDPKEYTLQINRINRMVKTQGTP